MAMYGSTSYSDFETLDLGEMQPVSSRTHYSRRSVVRMISSRTGLIISLFLCASMILYQRVTIHRLQNAADTLQRGKRSLFNGEDKENDVRAPEETDDEIPISAKITKSSLRKLCEKHSFYSKEKYSLLKKQRKYGEMQRKRCSTEFDFSTRKLIAKRPNKVGSAVKDGQKWYLTEFHLGYTILVYHNDTTLNTSLPIAISTLPYPFHGTDGTVHNKTVVYMFGESLIAYNMITKSTRHHAINASLDPLYQLSNSRIDAQADEHGLWILYRQKGESNLSAVRLLLKNLKEINRWSLPIDGSDWCNSFIRCGVLYSVTCNNGTLATKSEFDFYHNEKTTGPETKWKYDGHLSNVQYDPVSQSLNMFDYGNIYSVPLRDRQFII